MGERSDDRGGDESGQDDELLIGEERVPVRAEPGKRARFDYEYVRNGTANVFMFVDVNRLSGGDVPALCARRILSRIEFHFTPKHASWLNMVEIEIGVMVRQCLSRRIAEKATLVSEIAKWERRRNREGARIEWVFTVDRAREKLGRAYPTHAGHRPSRTLKAA